LHLWSENPRDPIDAAISDYDVIKHAIEDNPKEWNLDKLAKEMGGHYDFSEIPTVVLIDGTPIVYDGNRRVAVLKYLQGRHLYSSLSGRLYLNDGPDELRNLLKVPCNVCDVDTALTNIERKHSTNGSWGILQREYFLNKHRGQKKSLFQELEERTGIISQHPKMNQRFVKDEVLTEKNLQDIGFSLDKEKGIVTNYSPDDSRDILGKVVSTINNNVLTTRSNNRGKLRDTLIGQFPELKDRLNPFDGKEKTTVVSDPENRKPPKRRTQATKQDDQIFGRALYIEKGKVNDLYLAISSIYENYRNDTKQLAIVLPVIGMSLRLVLDVAARVYFEKNNSVQANKDQLYKDFMKVAKKDMNQGSKNYLSLTSDWLSDKENIDGVLSKYAHGNIITQKADILKASVVVGDILEEYFKK
jgi:hypothetical protein